MRIMVTGGAGFIGSSLVRYLIDHTDHEVINLDALTYAGNLDSLESIDFSPRYSFVQASLCERPSIQQAILKTQPDGIIHLAAESHVDRSIDGPGQFVETNVTGTFNILEEARAYWNRLEGQKKERFRFQHVSTDEVYGDLEGTTDLFTENTPYSPSSPYSASKAASDMFVRAWNRTYGLPILITNCSNNYGPFHFPEKLIPHIILKAIAGEPLPIYGDGRQIRDWLYVEDHARALMAVFENGPTGETYNIGGHNEMANIDVVHSICDLLEELAPNEKKGVERYRDLIRFVSDRPGHDVRYAIDASKIEKELGWVPVENFETGLRKTVMWYLANREWWQRVLSGDYRLTRRGA